MYSIRVGPRHASVCAMSWVLEMLRIKNVVQKDSRNASLGKMRFVKFCMQQLALAICILHSRQIADAITIRNCLLC